MRAGSHTRPVRHKFAAQLADKPVVTPRSRPLRFLPHSLLATFVVMILPSLAVTAVSPQGPPLLVVVSVLVAMGASVVLASVGSAFWMRRPGSQDLVFGDLMLWGWLRKLRAERRLGQARALLGAEDAAPGSETLTRQERCDMLQRLAAALEARDAYTHGHTRRVTRHAERIAREMGLPAADVMNVRIAAALHDVGKLHTPRNILTKVGRLTDDEFAAIKKHPVDGAEMVADVGEPEIVAMVRHHHERLDGTGYPDGLAGHEIPLGARIISVADTFDAMTSSRPYRSACKHKKALDVLSNEAGSQLDPAPVAAFMRYYSGKRSVAWSAFVVAAPQRLGGWIAGGFQAGGAAVVPVAQGVIATGLAALAGASMGGPAASARDVVESGARDKTRHSGDAGRARHEVHEAAESKRRAATRRGAERRGPERGRRSRPQRGTRLVEGPGAGSGGGRDPQWEADNPERRSDPGPPPPPPEPDSGGTGPGPAPSPIPKVDLPSVDVPIVQEPEVDVLEVEVPVVDVPDVQVPGIEAPRVDLPSP